jgi:hypothetical protein
VRIGYFGSDVQQARRRLVAPLGRRTRAPPRTIPCSNRCSNGGDTRRTRAAETRPASRILSTGRRRRDTPRTAWDRTAKPSSRVRFPPTPQTWIASQKSEKDRIRTEQRDRIDHDRERRGFALIAAAFDAHRGISTVRSLQVCDERNTVGSRARTRLDLFYAVGGGNALTRLRLEATLDP